MSSAETSTTDGEDRISKLPEDVIIHILSFLETQHVVQTSVLAKRWKHLCYTVPNIILDLDDINTNMEARYSHLRQCISFIDRRLHSFPDNPVLKISLTFMVFRKDNDGCNLLKNLLVAVTRVRVQQLCLELPYWDLEEEIPGVFTCESLVELSLGKQGRKCFSGITLLLPRLIHLPNLKILHLRIFGMRTDAAERLITSCPMLESLTLIASCDLAGECCFNISLPYLKRLVFRILPHVENWKYRVVVDAPVLETLHIGGHLGSFHFTNPPSTVEARIVVFGGRQYFDLKESYTLQLLTGISSVKSLRLSVDVLKVLDNCKGRYSLFFPNLTQLKLGWIQKLPLLELLRLMPNLEYLKLRDRGFYTIDREDKNEDNNVSSESDSEGADDVDDDDVRNCVLLRMKVIEIEDNHLWRSHMPLVKYLLKNAKVLQKIEFGCEHITYFDYGDTDPELMGVSRTYTNEDFSEIRAYETEMLKLPKGSEKCKIEFSGPVPTNLESEGREEIPNQNSGLDCNPKSHGGWNGRCYWFLICLGIACLVIISFFKK